MLQITSCCRPCCTKVCKGHSTHGLQAGEHKKTRKSASGHHILAVSPQPRLPPPETPAIPAPVPSGPFDPWFRTETVTMTAAKHSRPACDPPGYGICVAKPADAYIPIAAATTSTTRMHAKHRQSCLRSRAVGAATATERGGAALAPKLGGAGSFLTLDGMGYQAQF